MGTVSDLEMDQVAVVMTLEHLETLGLHDQTVEIRTATSGEYMAEMVTAIGSLKDRCRLNLFFKSARNHEKELEEATQLALEPVRLKIAQKRQLTGVTLGEPAKKKSFFS